MALFSEKNKIEVIRTQDGSFTLRNKLFEETYHSTRGAIGESLHVFINTGFKNIEKNPVKIFEVGFGSGLNAILTLDAALKTDQKVVYHAIELYPVDIEIVEKINFPPEYSHLKDLFLALHKADWNKEVEITEKFVLKKIFADLTLYDFDNKYDLVYFDAFSYDSQPQLWSRDVLCKIYNALFADAILVTYSAKGVVKQTLRDCGFEVKRLQGALGKRHMLRAKKIK